MNLSRLRWGEWIAAIAGAELVLVTFRAWYEVSGTDAKVTAWDALDNGRYLLLAAGVLGVLVLLLTAAGQAAQSRIPLGAVVGVFGLAAAAYAAYRIATPPDDGADPAPAAFLGLLSALGVAIGGFLSARDQAAEAGAGPAPAERPFSATEGWGATGAMDQAAFGAESNTWSAGAPTASSTWEPPAPAPDRLGAGLQPGDHVALTAGGSRWPVGTVARVIQVFAGGALVEVAAADGVNERFEVPEEAFERVAAGGAGGSQAPTSSESHWSPALPAAVESREGDDWGFGETAAAGAAGAAAGAAVADDTEHAENGDGDGEQKRPGFFSRLFGGRRKDRAEAEEESDTEAIPAADVAGAGDAAESDTAVDEAPAPAAVVDDESRTEPAIAHDEPVAREPDVTIEEPAAAADEPDIRADEPEIRTDEPDAQADEPRVDEPPVAEPSPVVEESAVDEPPAVEPARVDEAPAVDESPPADEPPVVDEPLPADEPAPGATAGIDAAGAGAAAAAGDEPAAEEPPAEPKPRRPRSSASRRVPTEAVEAAAGGGAPKVGDEVQLKVAGGPWDAGTRGTVVDVFSAGVIVEVSDHAGRTERLDLPFEAVGPPDHGS